MRQSSFPHSRHITMTLVLVPARFLLRTTQLRALLDNLSPGSFLLCLPSAQDDGSERHQAWEAIRLSAQALGRPTVVFSIADLERTLAA